MVYSFCRYLGWLVLLFSFARVGVAASASRDLSSSHRMSAAAVDNSEPDESANCEPTDLPETKEEEMPEVGTITLYRVCMQDEDTGEWEWIYRDYDIPGQPSDNPEP